MKTAKRFISLGIAMLLLCALLTACVSQQKELSPSQQTGSSAPQQDLSELDMIKAEWKSYFTDFTREIKYIGIHPNMASSFYGTISKQPELNAIVDICKTLDLDSLRLKQPSESQEDKFTTGMHINIDTNDDLYRISFVINAEGKTTLLVTINGKNYEAYAEEWNVYAKLKEYSYLNQGFGNVDELAKD